MTKNISVIICCAGLGTRLGIETTKALLEIDGKPLILHQLKLLEDFDDIRIVVGYQAQKLIEIVKKYRQDIMFVFNYDYATTGPAKSLCKGLLGAREYVITLDGDLLIQSTEFRKFLNITGECIAVSDIVSEQPLIVDVKKDKVIKFCEKGNFEWTGLAKIKSEKLKYSEKNVYEMLEPLLPLPFINLEMRGIDTKNDYKNVLKWLKKMEKKNDK